MISQRHLFDIPDDIAYFNCAYYSPLLNESRNRLLEGVKSKSHPWERTASDFFTDAETDQKISRRALWRRTRWLCHCSFSELWLKRGCQGSRATIRQRRLHFDP